MRRRFPSGSISSFAFLGVLAAGACVADGDATDSGDAPRVPGPRRPGALLPTPSPTGPTHAAIHFVALGDTGTGDVRQMNVAAALARKCSDSPCDFGVLLGDNFYPDGVTASTDPQFVTKFQDPYGALGFPFYVVLGNHDYGNNGDGDEFELGRNQVAYATDHSNWIMPDEWYTFDRGAATFLGTNSDLALWDYAGSVEVQKDFFSAALDASALPWRIALTHHPYLSNGAHGNAGAYDHHTGMVSTGAHFKRFVDESLCGEVDLYLSGHDHNLQVLPGTDACPGLFVVSGSGASASSLPGTNATLFQAQKTGFAYITVTDDALTVQMIDATTDEVAFETTILR